jgi:hypothetical protein
MMTWMPVGEQKWEVGLLDNILWGRPIPNMILKIIHSVAPGQNVMERARVITAKMDGLVLEAEQHTDTM